MTFQNLGDIAAAIADIDDELRRADQDLTVDLVVVGGAAVLMLSETAHVTRDIDVFRTTGLISFQKLIGADRWASLESRLNLSMGADVFATQMPPDWQNRVVVHPAVSTEKVQVLTPSAEDLAVMKVFRLNSKDAADIRALAAIPGFDPTLMKRLFLAALPGAIGRPDWHMQSFQMVWDGLYPDRPVNLEELKQH